MSATTGYFVAGSSWLHRRNPLTKLLALALVLFATFLLPPILLPVLAVAIFLAGWSAGLLRPMVRAMRIPALLLVSIVLVNAFFFPGRRTSSCRRAAVGQPRGADLRLISGGRIVVAFLAAVALLFTTLADDMLESLISRGASHRIAFVVLSAVQMVPRMQERAGAILEAQQARGLTVEGSLVRRARALVPLIGPVVLGSLVDVRERTFALEARGFGARPGRTAYRIVADPPIDRWLRLLILAGIVAIILFALGVIGR